MDCLDSTLKINGLSMVGWIGSNGSGVPTHVVEDAASDIRCDPRQQALDNLVTYHIEESQGRAIEYLNDYYTACKSIKLRQAIPTRVYGPCWKLLPQYILSRGVRGWL